MSARAAFAAAFIVALLTSVLLLEGPTSSLDSGVPNSPAPGITYSYDSPSSSTTVGANVRSAALRAYDDSAQRAQLGAASFSARLAAEGVGEARTYLNLTRGGSIRNIGTNASHTEFAQTLTAEGWSARTSADGAVQIFEKDGARYVLRNKAASYGGWTADFYASGSSKITLKLRLGHQ
jgi:hypothetical protein